MKKKNNSTLFLVLILLVGMSLILYPSVSDYWNSFHQSRAIANYAEAVAEIDNELYQALWVSAEEYNRRLAEIGVQWKPSEELLEAYERELSVSGSGVMGYIEIPKIGCQLPIYHSIRESVLQVAIGHIEGSSLPVGGESTHCILSGHRGLPSARLFTDLDQLKEGDTFLLRILDETLTYQVDQIRIVLPFELDELNILPGQDLCTLVTCTPYGVNSHRLLVRGHRIENAPEARQIRVTGDAFLIDSAIVAPLVALPMLLALLVMLLVSSARKRARRIALSRLEVKTDEKP